MRSGVRSRSRKDLDEEPEEAEKEEAATEEEHHGQRTTSWNEELIENRMVQTSSNG